MYQKVAGSGRIATIPYMRRITGCASFIDARVVDMRVLPTASRASSFLLVLRGSLCGRRDDHRSASIFLIVAFTNIARRYGRCARC